MKIGIIGAGKIGISIATLLEITDFVDAILGRSYFDLTEDVATTNFVRSLAEGNRGTFMPQCGLAPGAINIIASGLAHSFKKVGSVEMRVGALPLSASNHIKYYLSWSTAGLINEYCQLGEALYQGRRIPTAPLDGVERLTIDGVEYEAFNTSGGVATMCESFKGRINKLNYKTLRYPGHRDLMKLLLDDLNLGQKQELLTQIFDQEVPLTCSDVVVAYVNSVGNDDAGLVQRSFIKKIYAGTVQEPPAVGNSAFDCGRSGGRFRAFRKGPSASRLRQTRIY
jgi:saccharopine dehydrogenase-like NADP-dependent oxidoreductase